MDREDGVAASCNSGTLWRCWCYHRQELSSHPLMTRKAFMSKRTAFAAFASMGAICAAFYIPAPRIEAQTNAAPKTYSELPSETPTDLKPPTYGYDYERRVVMIRMRDGVKLHTVILVPKGAKNAPILLTRTPYSADG